MKKLLCAALTLCLAFAAGAVSACSKDRGGGRSLYDISAVYDAEANCLDGVEKFTFYNNTQNEIGELKFNLYGNAFREGAKFAPVSQSYSARAYYAGVNYGGLEIKEVAGCASWQVCGEDQNILSVALTSPVYPGERAEVEITFALTLAKINHRTGVTRHTVNLGNFYPVLCAYTREGFVECPYYTYGDPFMSDCADYSVKLDLPEGYSAAASGVQTAQDMAEGRVKTEYRLQNARDFAFVLSNEFEVISGDVDGVELKYYYVDDADPQACFDAAADSFKYFNATFGGYIYPSLSVVQTGFCYGGMEYPALTMVAEGLSAQEAAYTTVHENAHQWWYAMVGSDQLTCPWQDEGLAEYSTVMFFENRPSYGYTRTGLVGAATRSYRAFFTVYKQLNGEVDTSMTRNLGTYASELEYNSITYNKGLLLFDTLREALGEEKFLGALKTYFKSYCGKIAPPEAIIGAFVSSGADAEGHFEAFLQGKILI